MQPLDVKNKILTYSNLHAIRRKRVRKRNFINLWSFRLSLELWAMGFSWYEEEGA
jgi:hypothetical protein